MKMVPVRWISVFLLLIFIQLMTSLVFFDCVLILSDGELSCGERYRIPLDGYERQFDILTLVVTLCLYVPVVLVAFALLAVLLASYAKDGGTFWFSVACQALSSLLILTGLIAFLLLNVLYVPLEQMTLGFYICVGVQLQLDIAAVLTRVAGTRLTSDWDQMAPNKQLSCT